MKPQFEIVENDGDLQMISLDAIGYHGYAVDSDGCMWSSWSRGCKPRTSEFYHRMKLTICNGYAVCSLRRSDGKMVTRGVHRIMMLAFVGPRPDGMQVCHWDGVRSNNRLDNLRYDTSLANSKDKIRHGTDMQSIADKKPITARACSISGCVNKVVAWGMCDLHYRQARRRGDVLPARKYNTQAGPGQRSCDSPGCLGVHHARGLCGRHYRAAAKRGEFLGDPSNVSQENI